MEDKESVISCTSGHYSSLKPYEVKSIWHYYNRLKLAQGLVDKVKEPTFEAFKKERRKLAVPLFRGLQGSKMTRIDNEIWSSIS